MSHYERQMQYGSSCGLSWVGLDSKKISPWVQAQSQRFQEIWTNTFRNWDKYRCEMEVAGLVWTVRKLHPRSNHKASG